MLWVDGLCVSTEYEETVGATKCDGGADVGREVEGEDVASVEEGKCAKFEAEGDMEWFVGLVFIRKLGCWLRFGCAENGRSCF
mmetsp:Transcript_23619/g.46513  ORF Transcript_23619/g.46513 Transcript_23619/m.46513 type:complete len:83 (+) Transcript_23619:1093-1341(+)